MDETTEFDIKELQETLAGDLEEGHRSYRKDGLTRDQLYKLDDEELVLNYLNLLPGDQRFDEAMYTVGQALDLPWQDGESLRQRYDGELEGCC